MNKPQQQILESALAHHAAGRLAEAEALYSQILQADPNQHDALHLLGVIAHQVGKNDIAVDLIGKALAIKPDHADAHHNLGNALTVLGRNEDAATSYRQATLIKPDYATAHYALGNALRRLGRATEAIDSYNKALALNPELAEAHSNLGLTLHDLGKFAQAADSFRAALNINLDFAEALYNLGNTLKEQGKLDDTVAAYNKALAIKPNSIDALYNLGNTLQALGKIDEAIAAYNKALTINPEHVDVRYNLGLAQLLMGDFENGFENYKLRWQTAQLSRYRRPYQQPLWNGQDLKGQTLFLYPEQGLGDFIQFSRYVSLAAKKAERVIVEVPTALACLYPSLPGADVVIETGQSPGDFDVHFPMLDLPGLFTTNPQSIPASQRYLVAADELTEKWRNRLSVHKKFRVGLIWAGRPGHSNDKNRSIDPALIAPLLEIDGVKFFSLQVERDGEAAKVFGPKVIDLAADLTNFAETAALMSNLDLIISVDSSPAHLAGALGCPVWTLLPYLPDWRWGMNRDDSPWYPNMRLLRQQKHGDWQAVIERVGQELKAVI